MERRNEIFARFGERVLVIGADGPGPNIGSETAAQLQRLGYSVLAPSANDLDVRRPHDARLYLAAQTRNGPPIRLVVYSAGVNHLSWCGSILDELWHEQFEVNVTGLMRVVRALDNASRSPARVVAVASDAATHPMRASAAYCASKAAMVAYVRVAARELGVKGWALNTVSPGKVSGTPMTQDVEAQVRRLRGWTQEQADKYENIAATPLGRAVTRREVAEGIIHVLEASDAFTGQDYVINGGR